MDEIDVAQQNEELFRQSALRAHYADRLDTLTAAKGRGTLPRHTTCCDCGDEIETARLEALPNVIRCIACQTKKERSCGLI